MQRDAAGDIETIDGKRPQGRHAERGRPVEASPLTESEVERQPVDREFGGAPLAAHQGAEAERDGKPVRPHLAAIVGPADDDGLQLKRRRRQQPRVQRTRYANLGPENAAGLGLELRPEPAPVDEMRPDQRG